MFFVGDSPVRTTDAGPRLPFPATDPDPLKSMQKERNIVKTGEDRLESSVLTNSSRISLVCTAAALPPGVADAVGGGAGVAPVVSPGQRLEVGLHKPLPPAHLVHALHAEEGEESELTTKASRQQ